MTSNAAQCSSIVGRKSGFTLAKNYGPRTWKSLAVFVVAACVAIHGQSSPKQMADPAVAALGSGFVSDTAQVNGTTLHYVRGGAGPAIILLHGFPEDWYAYHRIIPQLAKQFTVVAIDLRGLGGSTPTEGGYDAANMAEDVHQLAEHLHLEHVYVVGHDIGGMVAYAFARRYPETSRGVMMLDAPLPGLGPWDAVKANPITWHINFSADAGPAGATPCRSRSHLFASFSRFRHFQRCGCRALRPGICRSRTSACGVGDLSGLSGE